MSEIENTEILGTILKSTLGIITRRTSEPYGNMVIEKVLIELAQKYDFLKKVKIEKDRFKEVINVIDIDDNINNVDVKIVGKSISDFMVKIAELMGRDAGFYFIKEIKNDIPYEYENKIKDLGVNLDLIQSEFITSYKTVNKDEIKNSEIVKHVLFVLFDVLSNELGRTHSYEILNDIVDRLSTQYEPLKYVKINDIVSIQNVEITSINDAINDFKSEEIGGTVQKMIQEILTNFDERKAFDILEKIKNKINADYCYKLEKIGVDFDAIKLKQTILVKKLIKSLLEILSEASTESYAVLILKNIMKKYNDRFEFFNLIKIDALNLSNGTDAIEISPELNSVSPSELGRSIQKLMEKVSTSLGEKAGRDFLKKFKKRMGKAYLLRLEEIGVNLHMIELRRNLL